jgi:hypothetical protein
MFSLLPKFLQKTVAGFFANICQLFIDIFWWRREQKNVQKPQKTVSSGDRGGHFRGLIAKLYDIYIYIIYIFIYLTAFGLTPGGSSMAKYKMAVIIPHPPYSPDLVPCDFFLFPKMKLKLKGCRFDTIDEIQAESQRVLDTDRKGLPGNVPKMEETVGRVSTCGRELLRG